MITKMIIMTMVDDNEDSGKEDDDGSDDFPVNDKDSDPVRG